VQVLCTCARARACVCVCVCVCVCMFSTLLLIYNGSDSWKLKCIVHIDTMEAILQKWNKQQFFNGCGRGWLLSNSVLKQRAWRIKKKKRNNSEACKRRTCAAEVPGKLENNKLANYFKEISEVRPDASRWNLFLFLSLSLSLSLSFSFSSRDSP